VILYETPWAEAERLRAVIEDVHSPAESTPAGLQSFHERLAAKTKGRG
jgi:hypothetical protein